MTQFGIIIPLRPGITSNDWKKESCILSQTIQSVLNQTFKDFKVFVIYTDLPFEPVKDPRVQFIPFPFPFQHFDDIDEKKHLLEMFKSEKLVVGRWDKGRKITYGCKLAKEANCEYIMSLDSDDLISNRLFAYCASESSKKESKGWYAEKGYIYQEGSNYLIRVPKLMRFINGSTHILKADLVSVPDFHSTNWQDYNLFTDHGWIKQRLKETSQAILEPFPFAPVTYVVHDSNISKIKHEFSFQFKKIIKRIIRGVWLTKKLRAEFNIC